MGRKILFFSLFIFLYGKGFSQTGRQLLLLNDSRYPLTAIIQAANGTELDRLALDPGKQTNWTELKRMGLKGNYRSNVSTTPYQVIWQCPHEGIYSLCPSVSPGSFLTANQCSGSHYCAPKPKKSEKPEGKCIYPPIESK